MNEVFNIQPRFRLPTYHTRIARKKKAIPMIHECLGQRLISNSVCGSKPTISINPAFVQVISRIQRNAQLFPRLNLSDLKYLLNYNFFLLGVTLSSSDCTLAT